MERTELMKGWVLELNTSGDFEIVNRDDQGKKRFYRVIPGPYSPVIDEEPELAFSLGVNNYVDGSGKPVSPAMKVKGIIAKASLGVGSTVLYRSNLTNFFGRDNGVLEDDGNFILVAGNRYRLSRLVAENKNRILGYIAFYLPEAAHDGSPVQILEVEDLA